MEILVENYIVYLQQLKLFDFFFRRLQKLHERYATGCISRHIIRNIFSASVSVYHKIFNCFFFHRAGDGFQNRPQTEIIFLAHVHFRLNVYKI